MINLNNTYCFDIETRMRPSNEGPFANFYQRCAEFLCLVATNVATNETKVWTKDDDLDEMFSFLYSVDNLVAHNGIAFDIKALALLFPEHKDKLLKLNLFDTRWHALKDPDAKPKPVNGLFTYAQMKTADKAAGHPETKFPNSLSAWGFRLGEHKMDIYADYKDEDWANLELTDDLIKYCKKDVAVNIKLFFFILKEKGVKHNAKI